jgi:hypothetical protein
MKVAFVSLGSFGDCVNSTMMFKPLREKWPDMQLDVHTTTLYASAYEGNPRIDNLIKHNAESKDRAFSLYDVIPKNLVGYDKVIVPAAIIRPGRWKSDKHPELGYNLWCTFLGVLEELGVEYEWPLKTELYLTDAEKLRAYMFFADNIGDGRRAVLMETSGESGQTFFNDNWTSKVGNFFLDKGLSLILSRKEPTGAMNELFKRGAHNACGLTLRECSWLFNYCDTFISVSSGLCNACCTDGRKTDGNWFEVTNSNSVSSQVLYTGGRVFWYQDNSDAFVEMLKSHF